MVLEDLKGNLLFPKHIVVTKKRPDIVVFSNSKRRIIIIELTCPCEENMEYWNQEKKDRYADLSSECSQKGWKVAYFSVDVGARGYVSNSLVFCLKQLGFSNKLSKVVSKNAGDAALRTSFFIWLKRSEKTWVRNTKSFEIVAPVEKVTNNTTYERKKDGCCRAERSGVYEVTQFMNVPDGSNVSEVTQNIDVPDEPRKGENASLTAVEEELCISTYVKKNGCIRLDSCGDMEVTQIGDAPVVSEKMEKVSVVDVEEETSTTVYMEFDRDSEVVQIVDVPGEGVTAGMKRDKVCRPEPNTTSERVQELLVEEEIRKLRKTTTRKEEIGDCTFEDSGGFPTACNQYTLYKRKRSRKTTYTTKEIPHKTKPARRSVENHSAEARNSVKIQRKNNVAGLVNAGNSCIMNAVLQCLWALLSRLNLMENNPQQLKGQVIKEFWKVMQELSRGGA